MSYELPPSMTRYGAELERAIDREIATGSVSRPARPLARLRTRRAIGAAGLASLAAGAMFLSVDSDSGGPFLTPAYAAFTGGPTGSLVNVVHSEGNGPRVTFRTVTSFSWTADRLTMSLRWTRTERHRVKVQVEIWTAHRAPALHPIDVNIQSTGQPGTVTYFAYEHLANRPWVVNGGTTKERDGSSVTIRLFSPFWPNKHPQVGPFTFVQISNAGTVLTFKMTSATGWRTTGRR